MTSRGVSVGRGVTLCSLTSANSWTSVRNLQGFDLPGIFEARQMSLFCLSFDPELPPLPPTTTPKPGAVTTRPTTTTTTTPVPGSGFCSGKPDGMYPNPENKNSFYMCVGGITHIRFCGAGTVYDDACKCCTWP